MGHRRGAERLDRGNDRLARPFRLGPQADSGPTQPAKSATVKGRLGLDPALAERQADGEPPLTPALSARRPRARAAGRRPRELRRASPWRASPHQAHLPPGGHESFPRQRVQSHIARSRHRRQRRPGCPDLCNSGARRPIPTATARAASPVRHQASSVRSPANRVFLRAAFWSSVEFRVVSSTARGRLEPNGGAAMWRQSRLTWRRALASDERRVSKAGVMPRRPSRTMTRLPVDWRLALAMRGEQVRPVAVPGRPRAPVVHQSAPDLRRKPRPHADLHRATAALEGPQGCRSRALLTPKGWRLRGLRHAARIRPCGRSCRDAACRPDGNGRRSRSRFHDRGRG